MRAWLLRLGAHRRAQSVILGSGALTEHQAVIGGGLEAVIVGCNCGATRPRRKNDRYWYAEHVSSVTANYILSGER